MRRVQAVHLGQLSRRTRHWFIVALLGILAGASAGCARSWQERGQEATVATPTSAVVVAFPLIASPSVPSATATPILAARVNGEPILLSEYYRGLELLRTEQGLLAVPTAPPGPEGNSSEVERRVLNDLIDAVLVQQAASEMAIMLSDREVDAQVEADILAGGGAPAFSAWLESTGQTEQDYWSSVRSSLVLQRVALAVTGDVDEETRAAAFAKWLSDRRNGAMIEQWVGQ